MEPVQHLVQRLEQEGEKSVAFFRSLAQPDRDAQVYLSGSGWRVHDIIAHFASAERGFHVLLKDILAGGRGAPHGFDIDRFNEGEVGGMRAKSFEALIRAFIEAREETINLARRMSPDDLVRQGHHPWFGETEIGEMLKLIHRHNQLHQRDVGAGVLARDRTPSFYVYRLTMGTHVQTGLVGAASVAAYDAGRIKKHELTRPVKEDDRVRQIDALNAQTGPVFLVHRSESTIDGEVARVGAGVGNNERNHTAERVGPKKRIALEKRSMRNDSRSGRSGLGRAPRFNADWAWIRWVVEWSGSAGTELAESAHEPDRPASRAVPALLLFE